MKNSVYQTLIIGGGFTGLFTALHLSNQHYPRSVILIDKEESFSFKPLLYEYVSGEMDSAEVYPRFEELLKGSGIIFIKDAVQSIDLKEQEVKLTSGTAYNYSNLVLGLGSVTGYFGVKGAQSNAFPLRAGEDAIAIDKHLRECLQRAIQLPDLQQRRKLLTVAIVGGGASGIEIAATLADLLPNWYQAIGGNPQEIRIVLINHGQKILEGDINSHLRETAEQELQKRAVSVEMILGAEATAINKESVEYQRNNQTEVLPAGTIIWTTGTNTHPLIKALEVKDEHRDKHGRLLVTPTLQLPDFPEVFAGGDCAAEENQDLPPTAQVAYQQGSAIAHNLIALAKGNELKPVSVNIRGTLLKLGIENSAANLFNKFEVTGEIGHLIRQGTYLELLPTPVHDLKITTEWLKDEIFHRHLHPIQTGDVIKWVGGAIVAAVVARKLIKTLNEDKTEQESELNIV